MGCELLDPITPQSSPTPWPGARSARAPPRARSIASSAPASRCRSASRTAPTATSRSPSTPCAPPPSRTLPRVASRRRGDRPHPRQPRLPRDPARRPRTRRTRRGGGGRGAREARRRGLARAGDDRRLPRQQRQGPRASRFLYPARSPRSGRRQPRDHRRDSRVLSGRRSPGPRSGRTLTYGQSITDACMDWETTAEVSTSWPRPSAAARRLSAA